MGKLPKIKEEFAKFQQKAGDIIGEGKAGGDMVTVRVNGKFTVLGCRLSDEAAKIARMSKLIYGSDRLNMPRFPDIHRSSDVAVGMLRKALDAFARLDSVAAAQIVREDELIDAEFTSIMRQLITFMMEDPRTISLSLEILFVAKSIERIGDHAKNMAEYVIYMVKGKDVRHITVEELERQAAG